MLGAVETRSVSPVFVGRADELAAAAPTRSPAPPAGASRRRCCSAARPGSARPAWSRSSPPRPCRRGAVVALGGCVEIGADGLPFAPFSTALRALRRALPDELAAAAAGQEEELARLLPELGETPRGPARRGGHRPPLRTHRPPPGTPRRRPHRRPRPGGPALGRRLHPPPPLLPLPHPAHRPPRRRRHLPRRRHPPPPPAAPPARRTRPAAHGPPHRTAPASTAPRSAASSPASSPPNPNRPRSTRSSTAPTATPSSSRNSPSPPTRAAAPASPTPCATCSSSASRRCPRAPSGSPGSSPRAAPPSSTALLAAVAGLAEDDLIEALRAAVGANILLATPDGDGYRFRHSLVREAVGDDLLPGERSRLNRRYAEALEADPTLVPADERVIRLASYWYHAHDPAKALPAVLDASVDRPPPARLLRATAAAGTGDGAVGRRPRRRPRRPAPRRLHRGLPALRLRPGHHPAALPRPAWPRPPSPAGCAGSANAP